MKAAIPIWLDYYDDPDCDLEIAKLLCEISPSTIDRLLRPYRRALKGKSSTQPSSYLKNKIPMEILDSKVQFPGAVQADTVAHCGNSLRGFYANTLTVTDLFSGWTENRATWTKTAERVLDQVKDIRRSLPFYVRVFASDNGTEFINSSFVKYFENNIDPGQSKIAFQRSRPYRKDDQCYVEQKNDTHVRHIFGYDRYDHEELLPIMNDIYENAWNPLQNYFLPNMKLIKKTRIGGKIKKVYDTPKTAYQRVMGSKHVPEYRKELLKLEKEKLNPIVLQAILEEKLKIFRREFHRAKSLAVEIERKSA